MNESDWLIHSKRRIVQRKTMFAFLLLLALVCSATSPTDYVYGLIDRVTDSVESLSYGHK